MAGKNAGKTNCGNEELVFLACAIKEGRRRRLQMQLALNNLAARRKRFLNLAFLLSSIADFQFLVQFVLVVGCKEILAGGKMFAIPTQMQGSRKPSEFPGIPLISS